MYPVSPRTLPALRLRLLVFAVWMLDPLTASSQADVLRVPTEYELVGDAALVATAGDTVLVAPGFHYIDGPVTLRSGVALLAEGPRAETQLDIGLEGDRLVLAADGPDTTIVEGFRMLFNSSNFYDGIEVFTSAAIVRGNLFLDLAGLGIGVSTILLHDGGIVERNVFLSGHSNGILVLGGEAVIRYNTWPNQCLGAPFNMITLEVAPEAGRTLVKSNTFSGCNLSFIRSDPPTEVEVVNNVFFQSQMVCGGAGETIVDLHHNLFWYMLFESACEPDTLWGPGNIDWGDGSGDLLFCSEPGTECYELTIHEESPVVGAGVNGEILGAWPIGCWVTAVDNEVDVPPPVPTPAVGWPLPNPTSGRLRLPIITTIGTAATVDIYDVAGRLVRTLRKRPGATALVWDGVDAHGLPVATGAYYLRVRESSVTRTVRIVR